MKVPLFPLLASGMCIAFWPIWVWFANGTVDGSNDSAGLLAAATVVAIVWRAPVAPTLAWPLAVPTALLALYALATAAGAPVAVCALLAALALAALASAYRLGRRLDIALVALCLLALPLAATLQFYLGYPLRVVAGAVSVAMLRMNGLAVVRDGAMLVWDGQLISIDAPCSGVKMLWAGMYLACALAAIYRLGTARTIAALALAGAVIIAANAVRAAALFYLEAGLVPLPAWGHQATGMSCFIAAALGILLCVRSLQGAGK
jgi:exosortase/archaeosortase family protein